MKMKTDKYGIEIKVGDFVFLDSYTGMEYGTSAGTIQQIKKIGSKRISFDAGYKNLRSAQFYFITAYTLVGMEKKVSEDGTFYYPKFVRTATNNQMYNSIVSELKKGSDDKLTEALIKNETYKYENQLGNYKLRNSAYGFNLIWHEVKGSQFLNNGIQLI